MIIRHRSRLPSFLLGLMTALTACGTSTQDLGRDAPGTPPPDSPPLLPAPPPEALPGDGNAASTWEWLNPAPQGNRIRGMGGSADDDVWLVGDGNTVLHWDGERWSDRHGTLRGLDLYSVWSSGPKDVWVAGDHGVSTWLLTGTTPTGEKIRVHGVELLHFGAGKIVKKDSYWKFVQK